MLIMLPRYGGTYFEPQVMHNVFILCNIFNGANMHFTWRRLWISAGAQTKKYLKIGTPGDTFCRLASQQTPFVQTH